MHSLTRARLAERRYVGFMGMLLPFLCVGSCLLVPDKPIGWNASMSATYYFSPVLTMGLAIVASFLFTYRGYDKADRIVNLISAVSCILVAIFPCSVWWDTHTGIFNLPMNVSNAIHSIAASTLFISFIVNIVMNFTKGSNRLRNAIYCIIGGLMSVILTVFVTSVLTTMFFPTFWCEVLELELFGLAWLFKGRALKV